MSHLRQVSSTRPGGPGTDPRPSRDRSATATRPSGVVAVLLICWGGPVACGDGGTTPTPPGESNDAPTAAIAAPADGSSFTEGDSIAFEGTGEDPEDGALADAALEWTSDVDDALGTGAALTRADLSVGTHTVTLTATDGDGASGAASVEITVAANDAPTAAIAAPADGSSFTEGDSIAFEGTGEDAEDGEITGESLVWTSDVDGELGTGTALTRSDLSAGAHAITLTATDGDGASGTASIELAIGADADGDGYSAALGDCDDTDASIHPGAPDPIDELLTDSNCDGLDGNLAAAVLVAPDGSDTDDCGTVGTPCLTISAAVDRAAAGDRSAVYVAAGTYMESVVLPDGVSLYGGFATDFSTRDPADHVASVVGAQEGIDFLGAPGQAVTVLIEEHEAQAEVADLRIVGRDASGAHPSGHGNNTYAVVVRASGPETVVITRNTIEAGDGAPGAAGSSGVDISEQAPGGGNGGDGGEPGGIACDDTTRGAGGSGGTIHRHLARSGGRGGDGGTKDLSCTLGHIYWQATDGERGHDGGGGAAGGREGDTCGGGDSGGLAAPPLDGADGTDGAPGSNGSGGSGADVVAGIWTARSGTAGGLGADGTGAGGGGGAGGCDTGIDSYGAGGGGGGAGGRAAPEAGGGGTGGGGSFGIYVLDASPTITQNEIVRGAGGRGGDGADGAAGQPGGSGGSGGARNTDDLGTFDGADGGNGGDGGPSGAGAGGAGGASVGVATAGESAPDMPYNDISGGRPGEGGSGGLRPDGVRAENGSAGPLAPVLDP